MKSQLGCCLGARGFCVWGNPGPGLCESLGDFIAGNVGGRCIESTVLHVKKSNQHDSSHFIRKQQKVHCS